MISQSTSQNSKKVCRRAEGEVNPCPAIKSLCNTYAPQYALWSKASTYVYDHVYVNCGILPGCWPSAGICWCGWSSLFEITMTCTCLRSNRTTHIRRYQTHTERGGHLPLITAPHTTCEHSCQEGLLIILLVLVGRKQNKPLHRE